MKTVTDFILLGSKITADGDHSHEIKRHLLLSRKAMTKLDSLLKSRDIILPKKVHLVKATVFPVVMYGYDSWTIKKAEHQRTDAFNCGAGEVGEMVGQHNRLNGYECKQAPGDSDGQGSLACCSPWGYKESDMTQ